MEHSQFDGASSSVSLLPSWITATIAAPQPYGPTTEVAPGLIVGSFEGTKMVGKPWGHEFDEWARSSNYDLHKIQLIAALTLVNIAVLHDPEVTRHLLFYGRYQLFGFIEPVA